MINFNNSKIYIKKKYFINQIFVPLLCPTICLFSKFGDFIADALSLLFTGENIKIKPDQ